LLGFASLSLLTEPLLELLAVDATDLLCVFKNFFRNCSYIKIFKTLLINMSKTV